MTPVLLESPYAGDVNRNVAYARACMRDCFRRGEAPFASHLLYTQPGVLDDTDGAERALGIEAGLVWGRHAAYTVVYTDLGITDGMRQGIARALHEGRAVHYRQLAEPHPAGSETARGHDMDRVETCETCRFYRSRTYLGKVAGDCHRYPPILNRDATVVQRPITTKNNWCGEWKES